MFEHYDLSAASMKQEEAIQNARPFLLTHLIIPRWKTVLFKIFGKKIVSHNSGCRVTVFAWRDEFLVTSVEYINKSAVIGGSY